MSEVISGEVKVPDDNFLRQAIIASLTNRLSSGTTPSRSLRNATADILDSYHQLLSIRINPLNEAQLQHATAEVFGWRRALVNHENEPQWKNGEPPFESALLIWQRRCFPHNHSCQSASYAVLPTYPDDEADVFYNGQFAKPGSIIQKFWRRLDQHDANLVNQEGIICAPIRTGENIMFQQVSETIHEPGSFIVLGPQAYHTLEPLNGYSAASLNIYVPPMKRYKGQALGGPSCQSCDPEIYGVCSAKQAWELKDTTQKRKFGHAPGDNISAFLQYPGKTDLVQIASHASPVLAGMD